jgi:hypothetical protein
MTDPIHVPLTEPEVPGPDHRAEPTGAAAPNKAFWRTALQVGPVAALALLGFLPGLLQSILDGFGRELPPEVYAVLAGITATVTLIAAIAARVMAYPGAVEWFKKYAPFFAPQKSS